MCSGCGKRGNPPRQNRDFLARRTQKERRMGTILQRTYQQLWICPRVGEYARGPPKIAVPAFFSPDDAADARMPQAGGAQAESPDQNPALATGPRSGLEQRFLIACGAC